MVELKDLQLLKKEISHQTNKKYDEDENNAILIDEVIDVNTPILNNFKSIKTKRELYDYEKALSELYTVIKSVKESKDMKMFYDSGKTFDVKKLKDKYKFGNLKEKFPKFDIDKYLDYLCNPFFTVKNYRGETIKFDSFWVNKQLIAINQMIFNEMDLYILNIGKEGAGKSCWSSQQILFYYVFFSEVGLIDYSFDVKKMFFADINTFLENHGEQKNNDYFRIECLDEGNELNRSNFREEDNKQFKYEMRTERKMLRVIMINMQQIGELDTSISLSRVNFIYNCKVRSNKKAGMLEKGFIDMYIIPRGDNIYSTKNKKVLTREEILNTFAIRLDKKKDYYINLPNELIVHKFKFENIWGFNKEEYDDYIKDQMRERRFQKKMKLTDNQAYILFNKFTNWKQLKTFDLDDAGEKKMYNVAVKFFGSLDKYFSANPEKLGAMRNYYTNK